MSSKKSDIGTRHDHHQSGSNDRDQNIDAVASTRKTEQILKIRDSDWTSYICHFIFFLAAIFCFLPQILGYRLLFRPVDLDSLSDDKRLYTSLVVSIALTAVTLIESVLDSLIEVSKKFFTKPTSITGNGKSMILFKFPKIILIIILVKDFLMVFYFLPYQKYELFVGLFFATNILFTWCYFYNLTRLGNPIWTLPKVFVINFIFASLLLVFIWLGMSETLAFNEDLYISLQFLLALAFFLLFVVVGQWIHYVWKTCRESSTDALTYIKLIQASIFVFSLIVYLAVDWAIVFVPNDKLPYTWSLLGPTYLSTITYLMAICTVCVSIISASVNKLCSIILSNKLLEVREMFMRYLSHEMRTPLNTVVMGINLLIKKFENTLFLPKTSICYEIAYDIRSSCIAAVDILNDMLLFDKIESGHLALELAIVSPWSFIKDAVRSFFVQAQSAELKLLLKFIIPNFECFVNVDKHKLSQVIRNLVSNGLKFCKRDDGCVTVEVDVISYDNFKEITTVDNESNNGKNHKITQKINNVTSDDTLYLRLTVTDDGAGISKKNQSKLFKSIIQFNPGELQNGQGTGLGLYISKGLIDAHKGHIFVKSDGEGHGSTFTFLIPIVKNYTLVPSKESIVDIAAPSLNSIKPKDENDTSTRGNDDTKKNDIIEIFDLNQIYTFSSEDDVKLEITAPFIDPLTITTDDELKSDDLNYINQNPMLGVTPFIDIESPLPLRVINVLVVDDSAICRLMVRRTIEELRIQEYRIHIDEASDGKKALKMMKIIMNIDDDNNSQASQPDAKIPTKKKKSLTENIVTAEAVYDLILMDYQMPNMDGPTSMRHIRALGYKGQIIGLTGNVVKTEVEKMRASGANKVLTKPVKEEQFNNLFLTL